MELDTLDRDIKEREGSQQQSGIKGWSVEWVRPACSWQQDIKKEERRVRDITAHASPQNLILQ
jgi:hypothetical protein